MSTRRIDYRDWRRIQNKGAKYHNKKAELNGITFDSIKERDRYIYLKSQEKRGAIHSLTLQVPFELQPKFEHNGKTVRAIKYVADFVYFDRDGKMHIEDTKGFKTREYELKKKMMLYKGLEIEEV